MSTSPTVPATKACSGKCCGGCAKSSPRIWILATCGEAMCVLKKQGPQVSVYHADTGAVLSPHALMQQQAFAFDQLILVGDVKDMANIHAVLTEDIRCRVVAEIPTPLLPEWFSSAETLEALVSHVEALLR